MDLTLMLFFFFKETYCIHSYKWQSVLEDLLKNYLHLNIAVRLWDIQFEHLGGPLKTLRRWPNKK